MISAAPTILALETDSAWVVILAVSVVTLTFALILRRLIGRPGGLASGLFLSLPLVIPILAAFVYEHAALPEIAVLRPAGEAVIGGTGLMHLLLLAEPNGTMTPYALTGSAGHLLLWVGLLVSSFMLLRRLFGMGMVARLIARCRPLTEEEAPGLGAVVQRISACAGVKKAPDVLLLPRGASGAFAVGVRKGRILMSLDLLEKLDHEEVEAIVAHEIAHIQARDLQVLVTAGFLRDMVAWNPLAHMALRRLARDREFEADRRAAALTGRPLAVASGLLKAFEVMRTCTGYGQRFALAFLRPGALVHRRVMHLLNMADGPSFAAPTRALPYLIAALLVAVAGLQVAARVSSDTSAFAFVWNEPTTAPEDVWAPKKKVAAGDARIVRTKSVVRSKRDLRTGVRVPPPDLIYSIRQRDLGKWVTAMTRWTKRQKLPPAIERWQRRESWAATRLGTPLGAFGLYRINDLNEVHSS